ncbi:HNH endonuclease [Paraburkholderia dipogonis]|uniref:HNH endonuclease n=1 Tax=Paraburkholderia dipogonis TaxID=1211383 RepID=UPI0038BB5A69
MANRPQYDQHEIEAAYAMCKAVYDKRLNSKEAIALLVGQHGFRKGSAQIFIADFKALIKGTEFHRTLSVPAMSYFLRQIGTDYGIDAKRRALNAYMANIEYYERDVLRRTGHTTTLHEARSLHATEAASLAITVVYPDEVPEGTPLLTEGAVSHVQVNQYERNSEARAIAIQHWKCQCYVCSFDFETQYGELGRGFIHVHHLVEISSIGSEYKIDPINDLRPVCPNCHAMLHTRRPAIPVDELRIQLENRRSP